MTKSPPLPSPDVHTPTPSAQRKDEHSLDAPGVLDVLLEIQGFDRIPRLGFLQRGVSDVESVCEHSWHVAFLVSRLGRLVPSLDRLRAIELALEHDLAELRTGDLPRPVAHYLAAGVKRRLEQRVLQDLGKHLPHPLSSIDEPLDSLEHRFVKACDRLQLAIKTAAYHRAGWSGCADFLDALLKPLLRPSSDGDAEDQSPSGARAAHSSEPTGFTVVDQLLEELLRRHLQNQ